MPDTDTNSSGGWMSDVQRALGLILVGTIAICTLLSTGMTVFSSAPGDALVDMSKTLQAAAVNMTLIALGFFFGNTIAKLTQDASQQKVVDKLTSTPPGTLPPVPGPASAAAAPWWTKITDDDKNLITAAGVSDPRVAAFITAAQTGAANADDLNYLVGKNLLTPNAAALIQAP